MVTENFLIIMWQITYKLVTLNSEIVFGDVNDL